MNWKIFLLRFAGLIALALAGGFAYALTIHLLIAGGLMPGGENADGFGQALTLQTAFVYMGSILAGLISLFLQAPWRNVLYASPLYAPCLYAVITTLFHG